MRKNEFAKRNLQPSCALGLPLSGKASYSWPMASLRRRADHSTGSGLAHNDNNMSTININFNYKEYTYALACTR